MERTEDFAEETRDVCVTAIVGGILGLISPLAILSANMLFIPIFALIVILAAFLLRLIHRAPMIGIRLACIGFYIALFFGTAGWVSAHVYRAGEIESAKHFAHQWFELMVTGRHLEALQLQNSKVQRASGVGILKRYTTDKTYMEEYKSFMENDAVKVILANFQGAEITFKRVDSITFSRRLTSFFVVFELANGEGAMRTSREFRVQIAAAKDYSEKGNRYDWTTRIIEILP